MNPEDRMRELGSRDDATPSEAEWLEFRARGRRSVRNRRIAGAVGGTALVLAIVAGTILLTGGANEPGRTDIASFPTATPGDNSSDNKPPADAVYLQQWYVADNKLTLAWAPFEDTQESPGAPPGLTDQVLDALRRLSTVPGPLAESGVTTALPPDMEILDYQYTNEIAHVTFGGTFPDATDLQQDLASAQVVYTLTQFPEIKKVAVGWESGESGGVAQMPVTRKRYEEMLPWIVVEQPRPGEEVSRTFTLSGIANVYEGTVTWRLVGMEERYEKEGFTTATCGSGCWGTFSTEVTYTGNENYATLQVFQESAEDGSPLNMVEIPLNFARKG